MAKEKIDSTTKPDVPDAEAAEATQASDVEGSDNKETGGPKGLEPTRYGDWERKGIVSDF